MNVALTGWGILSPLGITREEFAESIRVGQAGIAPIEWFDTSGYASHTAAMLRAEINYKHHIPAAHLRRMDTFTRQLVYVACEAFYHAGLSERSIPPERRAVVVASGMNHTESIEGFFVSLLEEGPAGANPILFPSTIPNCAAGLLAIELECRGPNLTITQKETSAEKAISIGANLLANDEADVVLVAAGECLTLSVYDGLAQLQTLSRGGKGRTEGMWPFSRRRNGFVAGEGSAAVVLERASDKPANAPIVGQLVGAAECSQSCSPLKYPTDPIPLASAVEELASREHCDSTNLAFLSAAANSTLTLDACEAETISQISQRLAIPNEDLPIAAIKSSIGEFCGGGLTRVLAGFVSLESGICSPIPFDRDSYDLEFKSLNLSCSNSPQKIQGSDFLHLATAAGGQQIALWFTKSKTMRDHI